MILYADTSSLLKNYVSERHSEDVCAWIAAADCLATSRVTYPEAAAALARRQRRGDLPVSALRAALRDLARRWTEFMVVDLSEIRAGGLAVRHGLRGFDAVHLAAALTVRTAAGNDAVAFSSFDEALNRAAVSEGLIVLEPGT
jgi:predicted nucleic acid-binding protein